MPLDMAPPPAFYLPAKPALLQQKRGLFMPGFLRGPPPATRTLTDALQSTGAASSYTASGAALGSPLGTSVVVVVVHSWGLGSGTDALSSISIDGSGASIHQNLRGFFSLSASSFCAIASRATANTTGDVVITFVNNSTGLNLEIYRLNLLQSVSPNHSNGATNPSGSTVTSLSTTIDVLAGGLVIAGFANRSSLTTAALSGITQDAAVDTTSGHTAYGSDQNQSAASGRSISATCGASTAALAVTAWR